MVREGSKLSLLIRNSKKNQNCKQENSQIELFKLVHSFSQLDFKIAIFYSYKKNWSNELIYIDFRGDF